MSEAEDVLVSESEKGRDVFSLADLHELFSEEVILRLVANEVLQVVADGAYYYVNTGVPRNDLLERVVAVLRQGYLSYVSYESALSSWGAISQIPMVLTVATTGDSGRYEAFANAEIEFTHTSRTPEEILREVPDVGVQLGYASAMIAWHDLLEADRNLSMVDLDELRELGLTEEEIVGRHGKP